MIMVIVLLIMEMFNDYVVDRNQKAGIDYPDIVFCLLSDFLIIFSHCFEDAF